MFKFDPVFRAVKYRGVASNMCNGYRVELGVVNSRTNHSRESRESALQRHLFHGWICFVIVNNMCNVMQQTVSFFYSVYTYTRTNGTGKSFIVVYGETFYVENYNRLFPNSTKYYNTFLKYVFPSL